MFRKPKIKKYDKIVVCFENQGKIEKTSVVDIHCKLYDYSKKNSDTKR